MGKKIRKSSSTCSSPGCAGCAGCAACGAHGNIKYTKAGSKPNYNGAQGNVKASDVEAGTKPPLSRRSGAHGNIKVACTEPEAGSKPNPRSRSRSRNITQRRNTKKKYKKKYKQYVWWDSNQGWNPEKYWEEKMMEYKKDGNKKFFKNARKLYNTLRHERLMATTKKRTHGRGNRRNSSRRTKRRRKQARQRRQRRR